MEAGNSSSSCSSTSLRVDALDFEAPHNAVKAERLSVYFGKLCLLRDTELTIAEHTRQTEIRTETGEIKVVKSGLCYGLVGPNGCGKSTMLKLMTQRGVPVPHCWDVCYVGQQLPREVGKTPVEEVLSGDARRNKLLELAASLEATLGNAIEDEAEVTSASLRLAEVHEELSRWDSEERKIEKILLGLGFRRSDQEAAVQAAPTLATSMDRLSGGWRMRVQLAKALWLQPKLLLLDEPTNHLDVHALIWLEDCLRQYPHTTVIVSHSISFLHSACSEILWINEQKIESMPRDAISQEDLARMQRRRQLKFRFRAPDDVDRHGLSFHNVAFDYSGTVSTSQKSSATLRVPGSVRITGQSRVVLLGRNGSGKSTFLDLCAGVLTPLKGTVDRTQDLKVGHYSQDTEALDRCKEPAAMYLVSDHREALEARAGEGASARRLLEEARAVLSPFGIDGELAVGIPAMQLSGGQKVCVKFALLSLYPAHLLLLDEPTNHLDAAGRAALARGLADFPGGVLVVTHDEELIFGLIECNRAEAELLVCERGLVRKEREWGTHRLHTLRDDARRAEEADASAARQAAVSARELPRRRPAKLSLGRPAAACGFEPSTPPGFFRVSSTSRKHALGLPRSTPQEEPPILAPSPVPEAVPIPAPAEPSTRQPVAAEAEAEAGAEAEAETADDARARRIRSLRKKLQQIERLKQNLATLDANAKAKVASEAELFREVNALENGDSWQDVADACNAELGTDSSKFARLGDREAEPTCDALGTAPNIEVETENCVQDGGALSPSKVCDAHAFAAALVDNANARVGCEASDTGDESVSTGVGCEQHESGAEERGDDMPDSWEDIVSDAEVDTAAVSGCSAHVLAAYPAARDVTKHDLARAPTSNEADAPEDAHTFSGRHSRLRKDLVNLNKAAAKWLRQEQRGLSSRSVTRRRILAAPALHGLRSSRGEDFCEDKFLSDVLERAQASLR